MDNIHGSNTMNTGHRTIVALLTVIAVLLALNLIATSAPAANNETTASATGPPVPTIVKLLPLNPTHYFRVWSDGRVDALNGPSCDFVTVGEINGPVDHPYPVVDAIFAGNHSTQAIMLTYEDGRVDLVNGQGSTPRCTIAGVGTPSFCTGDVDRSGVVGIEDFLIVLSQWDCQ